MSKQGLRQWDKQANNCAGDCSQYQRSEFASSTCASVACGFSTSVCDNIASSLRPIFSFCSAWQQKMRDLCVLLNFILRNQSFTSTPLAAFYTLQWLWVLRCVYFLYFLQLVPSIYMSSISCFFFLQFSLFPVSFSHFI